MNYYERHIGDYIRDTVSLSMVQEGAYTRLLDQLYQTELPLDGDRQQLYRLARAATATERKAVDHVLDRFFTLVEAGYVQKRAIYEIVRFQAKVNSAKRSANWRWDKQREQQPARENTACKSDANAYAKAHANDDAKAMQTGCEPICESDAHQTPVSILHKPVNPTLRRAPLNPSPGDSTDAVPARDNGGGCSTFEIAKVLRSAGVQTHAADPRLCKLADDGIDPSAIAAACEEARRSKPDEAVSLAYVLGVLKRLSAQAKKLDVAFPQTFSVKPETADIWWTSNAGIERKGRELRLFAHGTESHAEFKDRIFAEIEKRKVQP